MTERAKQARANEVRATGNRLGPGNDRLGSVVGRRRRRRTRLGGAAVLVPDLDKGLGLRITPGQASLFQIVGPSAPQLTPLKGPTCHHAAIGQWVENRSSCPYTR